MKLIRVIYTNGQSSSFTLNDEQANTFRNYACKAIERKSYILVTNPDIIINPDKVMEITIHDINEVKE